MADGDLGREWPEPGSLRYFAVLFAPSEARPALRALYAFEGELRRVVHGNSHEAAHARLGWWRGEIDRLVAGRPEHPIAKSLLSLRQQPAVDLTLLHELIVAADLDLARMTYRSWSELDAYCVRAAGSLQTLLASALADGPSLDPAERDFARRLGSAVRQAEMLLALDRDIAAGRLYAPLDELDAAGLDPATLGAARGFRAEWTRRVAEALADLPGRLDDDRQRARQRHGLVLGALAGRELASPARVTDASRAGHRLEPMRRLWTAWRTALHHA